MNGGRVLASQLCNGSPSMTRKAPTIRTENSAVSPFGRWKTAITAPWDQWWSQARDCRCSNVVTKKT
ncbi:hypothetical protein NL676_029433 [Syzygium grande]|nr:hypothetical protein NL676_029433 [Syzygium grande]